MGKSISMFVFTIACTGKKSPVSKQLINAVELRYVIGNVWHVKEIALAVHNNGRPSHGSFLNPAGALQAVL
jgi:hypothetical protein